MRKNKGFTLVEILIVVVILGILAAIVIPQFSEASTRHGSTVCAATCRRSVHSFRCTAFSTMTHGLLWALLKIR
jgi:prepilin-type N-terminal cleavage/methylation domain-containing protein